MRTWCITHLKTFQRHEPLGNVIARWAVVLYGGKWWYSVIRNLGTSKYVVPCDAKLR